MNYPRFAKSTWAADTTVVILLGGVLVVPSAILHGFLFHSLSKFLDYLFDLGERSTNSSRQCCKVLTNVFGRLLLFLVILGLFVLPFIG